MEPTSSLPSIRKALHVRSTIRDSNPAPWHYQREIETTESVLRDEEQRMESIQQGSRAGGEALCCEVCDSNKWRYVCPKCKTKYCSVSCYQNHREGCTESFYQSRVNQVVQLEAKYRQNDTRQLLNRLHQEQQSGHETRLNDGLLDVLPKEELYRMLELLDAGGDEQITKILHNHPVIRRALDHAIQIGELQDWLLEPWHPWWRPRLATNVDDSDADESSVESSYPTLDDRLLQIPTIHALCPHAAKDSPHPLLQYNLIELLYSVAQTLRLYHGLGNALEAALPAAVTFMEASRVLSHDARYSSVPEALSSCVATGRLSPVASSQATTPWEVLAGDVALLCQNRRLVARALLEATDLFAAALAAAKREKADKEMRVAMKLAWKKLQFYLSWSREGPLPPHCEIEAWVLDWRPDNTSQEDLILPQWST